MSTVVIDIPEILNLERSLKFAKELQNVKCASNYIFSFAEMVWVEPFGMVYLSNAIARFRHSRPESEFSAVNFSHHQYAAHMGFYRAFDLKFGKRPGEAKGNTNYVPLTVLNAESLRKAAAGKLEHVGETIERRSRRLATILTRQRGGDLLDAVTYSFREIIRNAIEHSQSDTVCYCAQYWPSSHSVEVCVMDTGIGVRESLSQNPSYADIQSDQEALLKSLLPGVSARVRQGRARRDDDVWANSGYGLYMTSRLCRNGGNFFICSGDTGLFLLGETKRYFETEFQGTVLRLVLDTDRIGTLREDLSRFSKEGTEIAAKLRGLKEVSVSSASLMLSRDFKNGV
jgi:hypothetical protein